VIELDLDVMAQADWIIDVGSGAGDDGGHIQFAGTPHALVEHGKARLPIICDDG